MNQALEIFAGLLLLAGAIIAHHIFWGRFYRVRQDFDALLTATTSDGWQLAVAHFRPLGEVRRLPVILCHGLSANRFNLSLPGPHSLAVRLQRQGHPVFACDLRGTGDSKRPGARGREAYAFDFDDHLYRDAPAVLELALAHSGATRALWVGHSMGGLIGLGLAETGHGKRLAGVCAMGSPTHWHLQGFLKRFPRLGVMLTRGGRLRQRWIVRLVAPYLLATGFPFGSILLNPRNVDLRLHRRVAFTVLGDVSRGLLAEFASWIERDAWDTAHPPADLRRGLKDVACPVLLIAGAADRLCPAGCMEETLRALGAPSKVLVVFGPERGDRQAYGHGDLVFGRHAPEEIFPVIEGWLQDHGTV